MTSKLHTEWLAYMLEGAMRNGHTFDEVMSFDDYEWDVEHSFIQWLFPNKVPSRINLDAPVLTPIDIMVYQDDARLQQQCLKAMHRFLSFLGILWTESGCVRDLHFRKNTRYWLCSMSHNHLRITRFLHFCVGIGRHNMAESLLFFLLKECEVMNNPPSVAMRYWQDAVFGSQEIP